MYYNQKILIRADSSIRIGSGHVMRCLTLADDLKQKGAEINFVCREESGNLINYIESKKYKVHRLSAGIDLNEEKRCAKIILTEYETEPDWLIIDHYDSDISYESSLRSYVKKIMVIDDLANRRHDCDLLLDQNFYENVKTRYNGFVPDRCIKLIGPAYALLRPEFQNARQSLRERNGKITSILVFMGGVDLTNETCKVMKALKILNKTEITIDVVVGSSNPHRDEIEYLAEQMQNVICHVNVKNMAALMASADLGIGAGGTTTWERCSMGLPALVITVAENQINIAKSLAQCGCIINLGWHETVNESTIISAMENLISNPGEMHQMSFKGLQLVDAGGVRRVAEKVRDNDVI